MTPNQVTPPGAFKFCLALRITPDNSGGFSWLWCCRERIMWSRHGFPLIYFLGWEQLISWLCGLESHSWLSVLRGSDGLVRIAPRWGACKARPSPAVLSLRPVVLDGYFGLWRKVCTLEPHYPHDLLHTQSLCLRAQEGVQAREMWVPGGLAAAARLSLLLWTPVCSRNFFCMWWDTGNVV